MADTADPEPHSRRGGVRPFVIGMVVGAGLMFFFSGLVVKAILIVALVLVAIALARFL